MLRMILEQAATALDFCLRYRRTLHQQDPMESFILMRLWQESSPIGEEGKTMKMRTKLPIVSLVGAGALLLCALAVIIAPRATDSLR